MDDFPNGEGPGAEQPLGRDLPAGLPSRGAYVFAFLATVLGGVFGGIIGFGLADIDCTGNCGPSKIIGTVVGALIGAVGVGVVSVLVLRAMSEWRRPPKQR
ncbi:MAG: hypothetical protein E6G60_15695 [Actinobacteria bacterium]|nr:MAG: hypothetical protein E6G60_15695 [Actinomycetota bacterium]